MITNILNYVFLSFAFVTIFCFVIYIPRLRAWFQSLKKQPHIENDKQNRLAILVPARNESVVINDLFDCIEEQDYPRELFDVFVIVKDNNDPTIELAKRINGIVHIVPEQSCKGDALDACLKSVLKSNPDKYDAYIIVDADCMIPSNFLTEMNNGLASGRQVVQAKRIVKNYYMNNKHAISLAASCNGLIWSIIDTLGNRYKSDKNITAMTIGTGILFRKDVITSVGGWPYRKTLTEDIEFMYDSAIKGFTAYYNTYCKIYVEEATSLKVTNKRRSRWLTGVVDSKRIYNQQLKYHASYVNRYFTTALSIVYLFVGYATLCGILFSGFAIGLALTGNSLWSYSLNLGLTCFATIYVAFLFLTIACMISDHKYIKLSLIGKLELLLVHPLFYMGYIPIIARAMIFKKNRGWETIERVEVASN